MLLQYQCFWAETWCSRLAIQTFYLYNIHERCKQKAEHCSVNRTWIGLMPVTLASQSPGSKFREMPKFDQAPRWSLTRKDIWHKSLNELTLGRQSHVVKVERQGSLPQDVAKESVTCQRSHGRKQYRKKLVLKGSRVRKKEHETAGCVVQVQLHWPPSSFPAALYFNN